MTAQVRQNMFGAWIDGDVTAVEALHSLCSDYEELDAAYKSYEGMREQTRDQMSTVMASIGDRVEVKGFGVLTLTAPSVTEGYDKKLIRELIHDLIDDHPDIASRLIGCATKSARAGSLRIEREKPRAV